MIIDQYGFRSVKIEEGNMMKRGFSLLEMSIVFVIMATLLAVAISVYRSSDDVYKTRVTLERFEAIEKAIAAFVAKYNRIPCPASLGIAYDSTNGGIEYCYTVSGSNNSAYYSSFANGWSTNTGNFDAINGAVPTVTLGLPLEYQLDAWGNRIIYFITQALAGVNASNAYGTPSTTYKFENTNMGTIWVYNMGGAILTKSAVYVLHSAGPNGLGAYVANAGNTRNIAPTNTYELGNYNCISAAVGNIYVGDYSGTSSSASGYDDIVHYKIKTQIVKEAGSLLSNEACIIANTVLNTQDTNFNGYYFDPNCSYRPYDYRCTNYMQTIALKVRELCLNPYY